MKRFMITTPRKLVSTTDPEENEVVIEYDDLNRPIKTTVPDGTLEGI